MLVATFNYGKLEPWMYPQDARTASGVFAPNLVIRAGTLLGQVTATGVIREYESAASNGIEKWKWISRYSFKTDADGNIALGGDGTVSGSSGWAVGDLMHPFERTEVIFQAGYFRMIDLYVLGTVVDGTSLASVVSNGPAGITVYGIGDGRYIHVPS